MWWSEFERQVPDFAHEIRERLEGPGIVLVGTTRRDGSSRISPVEAVFERGQLYFDMMWRSQKALDLLQDQRIEVHAAVADPDAPQHKVRGRVEETHDAE